MGCLWSADLRDGLCNPLPFPAGCTRPLDSNQQNRAKVTECHCQGSVSRARGCLPAGRSSLYSRPAPWMPWMPRAAMRERPMQQGVQALRCHSLRGPHPTSRRVSELEGRFSPSRSIGWDSRPRADTSVGGSLVRSPGLRGTSWAVPTCLALRSCQMVNTCCPELLAFGYRCAATGH